MSVLLALALMTSPPDAAASDPQALGWMEGFPPSEERTIRYPEGGFFDFPQLRWTVCHFDQLMPTRRTARGLGAPAPLPSELRLEEIDAVEFTPLGDDAPMSWRASLDANYTDGIIVLHRGSVVYERYFGCLDETGRHAAMSVTKSMVGLLAEILVAEGVLDDGAPVTDYVPELAGSAFGTATVRQVMDMTTSLDFSEDYSDPDADIFAHGAAGSALPKPADFDGPRTYYEFLQTVEPLNAHGADFAYKTVNTDALGWIISRASGVAMPDLLSERIWSRVGMDQDACFTVDSIGTPFTGGGMSASLRDMARLGQLLLDEGVHNGEQIIPAQAVRSIAGGGDRQAFEAAGYAALEGWSYRGMWWLTHNDHGAYMARGVHGQAIYVDPTADMVIARFASHPVAFNAAIDPTSLPAYQALAEHLMDAARSGSE
jgi:CubicO group peptidase (beta-lactamase class C family)